jgi:hypothetical protein
VKVSKKILNSNSKILLNDNILVSCDGLKFSPPQPNRSKLQLIGEIHPLKPRVER